LKLYCGVLLAPVDPELPAAFFFDFLCVEEAVSLFAPVDALPAEPLLPPVPDAVSLDPPVAGADCPLAAPVLASVPRPSVLLVVFPLVVWLFADPAPGVVC
jgi:hypothetical protein